MRSRVTAEGLTGNEHTGSRKKGEEMKAYDALVIGFGKGGKTLAGALAKSGKKVALVERSNAMYGGTCINVACIPTKALNEKAQRSAAMGGDFETKAARYREAIAAKSELTSKLRQKNYDKLAVAAGVEVLDGVASFVGPHEVQVSSEGSEPVVIQAPSIFVNTGSRPFVPPVPGLAESRRAYVSEQMMELSELPADLVIVGGGYIGMEFASIYANFGSKVTVVQDGEAFLPREDAEVAQAVLDSLTKRGVTVLRSARTASVRDDADETRLAVEVGGEVRELRADAILVATGRRPNLEDLNPEAAGVELTERGAIKVDEHLRTSAEGVWAMGDVVGGLQFTYISLDDSRIVLSDILGDGSRTAANRGEVPYTVFLDPPFSRVGLTEAQARQKGLDIRVAKLPAAAIPKALVLGKTDGLLKVIVDAKTDRILGAHLFCAESHEIINLLKLAIDQGIPYQVLRDGIYTHPTMSEGLNDLFAQLG